MKNFIKYNLGICNYKKIKKTMNIYSIARNNTHINEIWFLEHYPIFTKSKITQNKDILKINQVPIINTDRGGKLTYHSPGQLIIYLILKLKHLLPTD